MGISLNGGTPWLLGKPTILGNPHMVLTFSSLSPPFCPYTPNSADPRPEMVNRPVTMAFEEGFQSALHAMHPGRWNNTVKGGPTNCWQCGDWEKWMFPKIVVPPKSSILIGFSIININHPFWGTPIFGNTQIKTFLKGSKEVRRFVEWKCF